MNPTNIDWCDMTWNPVVGCKRGCSYCYARKTHNARHKAYKEGKLQRYPQYAKPFDVIQHFPERLKLPGKKKKGKTVFVGSMSDVYYWDPYHTRTIISVCEQCPQHKFMFLTKDPSVYDQFQWPENVMLGATITGNENLNDQTKRWFEITSGKMFSFGKPKLFISAEPLMGHLFDGYGALAKEAMYDAVDLVVVGAMTKGTVSVPPKPEWIQSIRDNVPEEKIFWKRNIRKYL